MTYSFFEALKRTKIQIDREILAYRTHRNLEQLLTLFKRHGEFLPKAASYVMGYIDGLEVPLEKLSANDAGALKGSYFEDSWTSIHSALRKMWELYPSDWKDLRIYDALALAVEDFYAAMGIFLESMPDGGSYVHIPYTAETIPPVTDSN